MIWLQLIIPVLLICSNVIEAKREESSGLQRRHCPELPGIAKIFYKKNIICSGILLKPWIVLTTGDCVNKREPGDFLLTIRTSKDIYDDVAVDSFELDPVFEKPERHHNLALLHVTGEEDWCVGNFHLPTRHYTAEYIIKKNITSFIEEWEIKPEKTFVEKNTSAMVTTDYGECGSLNTIADWYCVKKMGELIDYDGKYENKINVAIPFYFLNKERRRMHKMLLGARTGTVWVYNVPGYFYQDIYPSVRWIRDYIQRHPYPPM